MDNLNSNRENLKISDLKKSKLYNIKMLEQLEAGDFTGLKQLSADDRNNRQFMEPLLYAVKNELNTYKVYKYYGENLQGDILRDNKELAVDIVIKEPELIEGTPISRNPQFILEHVQSNPEIIRYMDQHLKTNDIFINELNNKKNSLITAEVIRIGLVADILSNPELSNNKEFMSNAIKENGSLIEFASDELKNDYKFMRENCTNNNEVIDYVSKHTQEFGKDGLSATKDALVEVSSDKAISGFEEENKKIKEKIETNTEQDEITLEELLKKNKQLERHIKFFERIKNGEIDPVRAARLIDKFCVNLDEDYKNKIKQLLKLDEAILEREEQEKVESKEENKLSYDVVVGETKSVTMEAVNEETGTINKEMLAVNKLRETKEGEIGDNEGVGERT